MAKETMFPRLTVESILLAAQVRSTPIGERIYSKTVTANEPKPNRDAKRRVRVMVHYGKGFYEVNYSFRGCSGFGIHEPGIQNKRDAIRKAEKLALDLEKRTVYINGTRLSHGGVEIITED
jgi:hypothetical protein